MIQKYYKVIISLILAIIFIYLGDGRGPEQYNGFFVFLFWVFLVLAFVFWRKARRPQAGGKQTVSSGQETARKCPHCQKTISSKADKCPYCQSNLKSYRTWVLLLIGFIFLLIIIVSISLSSQPSNQNGSTQQENQPSALDVCLSLAQQNYSQDWDNACKSQGKPANCKLDVTMAGLLDNRHTSQNNDCYQRYNK